nr:hypothetical protein [Tanacetum cinerariifolium]
GLEVAFRNSTCFVRNEDGVDFPISDRSSNLYTIALNEVASNSLTCLLAKASSSQSWLWHQRLSHLNFATINNLVKNNLVQGLPKMKFEKIICVLRVNKGRFIENITIVVDDYSRYIWWFFLHSKDEASEVIISFIKKTQVNLQLQVQRVRTDNGTEFKNKTLAKFFDEDVGKHKAKGDIGVFVDYSKESAAFRIYNKRTRKIHESMNVNFDEISEMASKQFSLEAGLSNLNETRKSLNRAVSKVYEASKNDLEDLFQDFYDEYFDSSKVMKCNISHFQDVGKLKAKGDIRAFVGYSKESAAFRIYNKRTQPNLSNLNETGKSSNPSVSQVSESLKKDLEYLFHNFYDEYFDSSKIMKSSTTNVETSINEKVLHEVSESFQGESFASSLNDDVQQSPEEVILPQTNTHSISNNMIPNDVEASTSHNVFNKRLDDAYFDASTSFHDPSNVHTFYQPYPHEKKWTKDHPLHKIIGDPKSSVRTRGQLAKSCLFSCLLSAIEPASVVEALRDADWVSAMQDELDQFARLKVWRLVSRPEGKTIIKTK